MKNFLIVFILAFSCQTYSKGSIATSDYVDINQFVGKWYAIASLPQRFTRNCLYQSAEYDIVDSSSISVLNTCYRENRSNQTIDGKAVIKNFQTNAQLDVKFDRWWARLFNIKGDYNIIKIDQEYQYLLVGSRDRKSLWIMARVKSIPEDVYQAYLEKAKELNFDIDKLVLSKF